ncbi:uracil-DNA glycosylase-like isoform X2 [Montipora foliosa]
MNLTISFLALLLLVVCQNCEGARGWSDLEVNVTQRSLKTKAFPKLKCTCKTATYRSCTLQDYIYKHKCFPPKWKTFFGGAGVPQAISKISLKLADILKGKGTHIEPPLKLIFQALKMVSPDKIKAVILGQDPTPQAGQATGVAFSVDGDAREVPAVLNVLLEVALEGWKVNVTDGDLTDWTNEGVLLLNTALTITQGTVGSHLPIWRKFTKLLIKYISDNAQPSAWMLWGYEANSISISRGVSLINTTRHKILKGQHPSPRSVTTTGFNGFFAGGYFKCANEFLAAKGRGEIDWDLTSETFLEPCPA